MCGLGECGGGGGGGGGGVVVSEYFYKESISFSGKGRIIL